MSDLFWLTDTQMQRLEPYFPKSHGKPRVDDRRVLSGIIFINRNGLRWRDAPSEYGPPKTLYNRWVRWSRKGVFARILTELAREGGHTDVLMIDATHLKAHRTASSLGLKRGAKAMPELAFQQKPRKGAALGIRRTVVSPGGAASRTRPLFRIVYGILTEKSPNRPGWLLFPRDFPRLAAHTSPACGGVAGCCAYTYLHVLPPSRLTNAGLTRSHGPSKTPYDQF